MRRWELWEGPDLTHSFFASDNQDARRLTEGEGAVKIWETEATSYNDAKRALHEHMGWEPYKPMLREDGTPYPEDEDDSSEA
ncbi:MAG TPA: hypothetical protein DCQ30_07040 [Acidimicrobiaceae bacterium]|nr:hypothetical protein [Acidimicrobiaceae bacterium]